MKLWEGNEAEISGWLTDNPTKRPQYVLLFPDIPSQVKTNTTSICGFGTGAYSQWPGVQYSIRNSTIAGWAPFISNGGQSSNYATDGSVVFSGASRWWIIMTIESFNGQRCDPGQGTFWKWYSANAFGGTNFLNTPVGAVTHVQEPTLAGVNNPAIYFGSWVLNKRFPIAAWYSTVTPQIQVIGDPFLKR